MVADPRINLKIERRVIFIADLLRNKRLGSISWGTRWKNLTSLLLPDPLSPFFLKFPLQFSEGFISIWSRSWFIFLTLLKPAKCLRKGRVRNREQNLLEAALRSDLNKWISKPQFKKKHGMKKKYSNIKSWVVTIIYTVKAHCQ